MWKGYGWGFWSIAPVLGYDVPVSVTPFDQRLVELGKVGAVLAYLPCVPVVYMLYGLAGRVAPERAYAFAGLGVIALLVLADTLLGNADSIQALRLSGWALAGVLTGAAMKRRTDDQLH